MFKDTFTIKKTAYHVKMMKYIWGFKHTDFSHVCPYFWLSLFNHFIFIFYAPLKEGVKLIAKTFSAIYHFLSLRFDKIIDEYNRRAEIRHLAREKIKKEKEAIKTEKWRLKWEAEWAYYKEHPEEIAKKPEIKGSLFDWLEEYHYESFWAIRDKVDKAAEKLEHQKWVEDLKKAKLKAAEYLEKKKQQFLKAYEGSDAGNIVTRVDFEEYFTNWQNQKKQREIEAEAARRRATKDRINRILRITKPLMTLLAYTLGAIVAVVVAYYLFRGISNLADWFGSIKHSQWIKVGRLGKHIGFVILALGGIVLLALLINYLNDRAWDKRVKKYKEENNITEKDGNSERLKRMLKRDKEFKTFNKIKEFLGNIFISIGKFFYWIWNKCIVKPWKSIVSAFKFLLQMFKNNCPGIIWEDK